MSMGRGVLYWLHLLSWEDLPTVGSTIPWLGFWTAWWRKRAEQQRGAHSTLCFLSVSECIGLLQVTVLRTRGHIYLAIPLLSSRRRWFPSCYPLLWLVQVLAVPEPVWFWGSVPTPHFFSGSIFHLEWHLKFTLNSTYTKVHPSLKAQLKCQRHWSLFSDSSQVGRRCLPLAVLA